MLHWIARYARWLHTQWPAGGVEKAPFVQPDGSTNVPGLFVVGDLAGMPLLKVSADSGARAVQKIAAERAFSRSTAADILDLVIIGAGVSGMAAALEARQLGLRFAVLESAEPFATVVNFPKGKPIYTYPTEMRPAGALQLAATVREDLLVELRAQTLEAGIAPRRARVERVVRRGGVLEAHLAVGPPLKAQRIIVAIGRSGDYRRLGVPGEQLDKVSNRLHDPMDYADKDVLIVGGGDSALETALAIAQVGGRVTLSYRGRQFARPKAENVTQVHALAADPHAKVEVESPASARVTTPTGAYLGAHRRPGTLRVLFATRVQRIDPASATLLDDAGQVHTLPNDNVFVMIGREAPLDFFRRSGVRIAGEHTARDWMCFGLFLLFCLFVYHWKADSLIPVKHWFETRGWFPFNVGGWLQGLDGKVQPPGHLLNVLALSMSQPSFYYTLAYCLCVVVFGLRRIARRQTPHVRVQTGALMLIQCVPLFLLPEILLPWAGANGWFEGGALGWVGAQLFPNGEYWRAYGLILAWPLFIWNWFTAEPLWGWLIVGAVQTFVLIPLIIYFWGKGAYCGWICSCGALAETLGDTHRHKMPHGPSWNRVNLVGQALLAWAIVLMVLRVVGWAAPQSGAARVFDALLNGVPLLNYKWLVDVMLAGVIGVGCYFWFSGRVWCRFACPLAALMHIYARFSRFRILADKKKCISCNVCTSVCHQGIDVMSFANKGLPMADPQCVRCSACVQSCPTGVLTFGQIDPRTGRELKRDRLAASLVQLTETGRPRGTASYSALPAAATPPPTRRR